ncbi:MAG TPA: hypothetical protein VNJ01_05790 [Bacteriovoracaceae bacterium]|nr:hypothetical protein [Bacteriovoracaceae bacterium]
MSDIDEDDKPTVKLDLNALKNQALKKEEELARVAADLEFSTHKKSQGTRTRTKIPKLDPRLKKPVVILFDLDSDFFEKSLKQLPQNYDYQLVKTLAEFNKKLKTAQIVVFNYDLHAKAASQLIVQIKKKLPKLKCLLMASAISPAKAKLHAKTPAGAHGYYQFPLDAGKVAVEFQEVLKKISLAS